MPIRRDARVEGRYLLRVDVSRLGLELVCRRPMTKLGPCTLQYGVNIFDYSENWEAYNIAPRLGQRHSHCLPVGSDEKRAQVHRSKIRILFRLLRHCLRSLLVFQGQGLAETMLVIDQVESIVTYLRQLPPQTHPAEGHPSCHNRKRKNVSVGPCLRCEVLRVTEYHLVASPTLGDNCNSQLANYIDHGTTTRLTSQ